MKKLKLFILLMVAGLFASAQNTEIEFHISVQDGAGNAVANQQVTAIDSLTNSGINVYNYTTDSFGNVSDTILTSGAGTLWVFTLDSCQVLHVDNIVHTPNNPFLTLNTTFNVCSSTSPACDATFSSTTNGLNVDLQAACFGSGGYVTIYWGDGDADTILPNATPPFANSHMYAAAGSYQICVETGTLICYDKKCDSVNVAPITNPLSCNASFIVDTVNSQTGSVVLWNNSSVTNANPTTQVNYLWDFGDGSTSSAQFPTHQYAASGMYNVCVTIMANDFSSGNTCTSTFCDSLGVDQNGNLIYKGLSAGWELKVLDPNSISIEEKFLNNINTYPNPVIDVLNISIPEELKGLVTLELYTITGDRILSTKNNSASAHQIEVNQLPNGLYILNVNVNGQSKQVKIVKQN